MILLFSLIPDWFLIYELAVKSGFGFVLAHWLSYLTTYFKLPSHFSSLCVLKQTGLIVTFSIGYLYCFMKLSFICSFLFV